MYDRNNTVAREATLRQPAYEVQARLFYEDCAMCERVAAQAFSVLPSGWRDASDGHKDARRAVAELQRRARLDPNATPLRAIP